MILISWPQEVKKTNIYIYMAKGVLSERSPATHLSAARLSDFGPCQVAPSTRAFYAQLRCRARLPQTNARLSPGSHPLCRPPHPPQSQPSGDRGRRWSCFPQWRSRGTGSGQQRPCHQRCLTLRYVFQTRRHLKKS